MAKYALVVFTIAMALSGRAQNRVTCTTMLNQVTCYQPPDYVAPIIDAMKSAADQQLKMRQLQLQREELNMRKDQLKLEQDRQRVIEEQQRKASELQQKTSEIEVAKLLQSLQARHPDFNLYEAKMAKLVELFLPSKDISPYDYVEGLYLMAKHADEAKHDQ